ncbi:MAG TPA: hypothetical protein VGH96_14275 [Streptosporangiaceae bacterium]|jgi:hypothetical protein
MEHDTGPDGTEQADQASAAGPVSLSVPSADREVSVDGESGEGAVRGSGEIPVTGTVRADPVPTIGEPRVDAALKLLDRLPGLPVSEHPELFEQVHAQLSDVLGELDSGPGGPAGG